jgi:hypothetical protein
VTCKLAFALLAAACGADRRGAPADPAPFSLVIHANWLGVIYEYDDLMAALAKEPASQVVFRAGPEDIAALVIGPQPSPHYDLVLTPAASARWQAATDAHRDTAPFELALGDRRLLAGVVYTPIGAAAIRTPVLHGSRGANGEVTLTIAAYQGAATMPVGSGGRDLAAALAQRIDDGALRRYFAARGTLRVLSAPPAVHL